MGSFVSTSKFVELPFRQRKISIGNIISFDKDVSNEEIINTIVNSNCSRIQSTIEPTIEEIYILNEIYKRNPNIGFRLYNLFGPKIDLSFLLKIYNLKVLYLETYTEVENIETLEKLKLKELHLGSFGIKNYDFLKRVDSSIKALSISLEDKTFKMDINDILHMKDLESLAIRNVKKGIDKIPELKRMTKLLLRSIDIKDYRFLQDMNIKKLYLNFQKSEYFINFGINKLIEEISLWRNPKLTDLSFLLQFPNLKKIVVNDQSKINNFPDLTNLKNLEEVYYFCKDYESIKKHFNKNVKFYSWYNPCDVD